MFLIFLKRPPVPNNEDEYEDADGSQGGGKEGLAKKVDGEEKNEDEEEKEEEDEEKE